MNAYVLSRKFGGRIIMLMSLNFRADTAMSTTFIRGHKNTSVVSHR